MMIRIRGYQFKSVGRGEPKANPLAYRALDDGSVTEDNRGNSLDENGLDEEQAVNDIVDDKRNEQQSQ